MSNIAAFCRHIDTILDLGMSASPEDAKTPPLLKIARMGHPQHKIKTIQRLVRPPRAVVSTTLIAPE
jgi:hypothetical protein